MVWSIKLAGTAANIIDESEFSEAVEAVSQTGAESDDEAAEAAESGKSVPLLFHFKWQDMVFEGEVRRAGDESGAVLKLAGKVATLPFTAENVFVRKMFLERYRSKGFALGKALRLTSQSNFELILQTQLPPHATPADVIKAVTVCLLGAKDELIELNSPSG